MNGIASSALPLSLRISRNKRLRVHSLLNLIVAVFFFVAMGVTSARATESTRQAAGMSVFGDCRVSNDDERWIEVSVAAWEGIRRALIASHSTPGTIALFFDDDCVYRADPLALDSGMLRLGATRHEGHIRLPSGGELPAGVASFAAPNGTDAVFFVMALPSVWRAAGKQFPFDMDIFLTAVMVHEMSHVVQFRTYLKQSASVEGIERLGKNINDDIVQDRFGSDAAFSASVRAETQMLYSAAGLPIGECRELARRALAMIRARHATHYVDELRALAELEDIFLTLEGAGQFAALTWLTDAEGGRIPNDIATREFGDSVRYWSQRQGLALFLVLERLSPDWRNTVYGEGDRTVLQLLEEALR